MQLPLRPTMMPFLFKSNCECAKHLGFNTRARLTYAPNSIFRRGSPSQWFMAASPRHPMIYFSVLHLMAKVMNQGDLGNFQVVFTTGPGAVNAAFMSFMRNDDYYYNAPAGRYIGVGNRSVTIVGNQSNENMYITRVIEPLRDNASKHKVYQKTNMTHLTETGGTIYKPRKVDESCMSRLYSLTLQDLNSMSESAFLPSNDHAPIYY